MHNLSWKFLQQDVRQTLAQSPYPPKKLALIHTGIALAVSALSTVLSFLLQGQIASTGGLAGLGTRSMLETVDTVLTLLIVILLPYWEIGFLRVAMDIYRKKPAHPSAFTAGFSRFGKLLRLNLLKILLILLAGFLAMQLSTILFTFSPGYASIAAQLQTMLANDPMLTDITQIQALLPAFTPLYILLAVIFGLLCLVIFFFTRFADYIALDTPAGARQSLLKSFRAIKQRSLSVLKIDLHFLWYYLLLLLCPVIGNLDMLLSALGISLPLDADVAFFLFYGLQLALQLILAYCCKCRVAVTYAAVYDALKEPEAPPQAPIPW